MEAIFRNLNIPDYLAKSQAAEMIQGFQESCPKCATEAMWATGWHT